MKKNCDHIGATNVGKIIINEQVKEGGVIEKGEEMGGFKLGSSIVLVFEAPEDFKFNQSKEKLRVGVSMSK